MKCPLQLLLTRTEDEFTTTLVCVGRGESLGTVHTCKKRDWCRKHYVFSVVECSELNRKQALIGQCITLWVECNSCLGI